MTGALCNHAQPVYALNGQTVMEEGQPGREMYMLMSGELEVFKKDVDGNNHRLGFLSEGSFFGEVRPRRAAPPRSVHAGGSVRPSLTPCGPAGRGPRR